MPYIRTAAEAELNAAAQMRALGYSDAQAVPGGPDGGIDVRSSRAYAQVKWRGAAAGRPEVQNLYGARGIDHDRDLFFFVASSFTRDAVQYADAVGIKLFSYEPTGEITPINLHARSTVSHHVNSEPNRPDLSPNYERNANGLNPWVKRTWKKNWRIICAVFCTAGIFVMPFVDGSTSDRLGGTLIYLALTPAFWWLHVRHQKMLLNERASETGD